jgi:hypothetical protein
MASNTSTRPERARKAKEFKNSNKIHSFPAKPMPHSMMLTFKKYDYSNLYSKINTTTTSSNNSGVQKSEEVIIELPFPTNLSDVTSLRVETFGRSAASSAFASSLSGAQSAGTSGNAMLDNASTAIGNIAKGIQKTGVSIVDQSNAGRQDMAAFLSQSAAKLYKNDFSTTLDSVVGRASNPKETLSFNGVNLKSYTFTWRLFPSNIQDSESIKNIVKTIKSQILPSTRDFLAFEKVFLTYPSTVDIQLLGVDESHFFKFKTSMVSSFNVNYGSGDDIPLISGGKPAHVTIDIGFSELEAHTAGHEDNLDEVVSSSDSGGQG